jgi:hypothetical protein
MTGPDVERSVSAVTVAELPPATLALRCRTCRKTGGVHNPSCSQRTPRRCEAGCGAAAPSRFRYCASCRAVPCAYCNRYGGAHSVTCCRPQAPTVCYVCRSRPVDKRPDAARSNLCAECRRQWCRGCKLYGGRHLPGAHPPPKEWPRRDRVMLADIEGLYSETLSDALRIACRRGIGADAADIVHDAIVVLLRRRQSLSYASAQYFFVVVKNAARHFARRQNRFVYVGGEELDLIDGQRRRAERGWRASAS